MSTETTRGGDVVDAYLLPDEETEMPPYRWTERDTLETDPDGFAPIEAEAGEPAGPGRGEERRIWGQSQAGDRAPNPGALDAAVRRARQAVALQDDPALLEAKSPEDLQADLSQQRAHRDAERSYQDRVYRDRLAELDAARAHERSLSSQRRKRDERVATAEFRREKVLDPTNTLVLLNWALRLVPWLALVPAVFAVVVGAVNVWSELDRINPATSWVNWAVEPLFTWPLAVILIAQILGAVPKPDLSAGARGLAANPYVRLELALVAAGVALNVGLHFVSAGSPLGGAVWLFVPAGFAFSGYLIPRLITDIRAAIAEWSENADDTGSHQRGKKPTKITEKSGENGGETTELGVIREPGQRSKAQAREEFFRALAAGEIDPGAQSINDIAKQIGTRWGNAKEFLTEAAGQ